MIKFTSPNKSKGYLVVIPTDICDKIEYQPGYGKFFVNEKLGLPINGYVEYRFEKIKQKENGKNVTYEVMHIIADADPSDGGRKVNQCHNDTIQDQKRKIGKARVSFVLSEFNEYLELQKPTKVQEQPIYNRKHEFEACMCTFHNKFGDKWETKTRRGITVQLKREE